MPWLRTACGSLFVPAIPPPPYAHHGRVVELVYTAVLETADRPVMQVRILSRPLHITHLTHFSQNIYQILYPKNCNVMTLNTLWFKWLCIFVLDANRVGWYNGFS